MAFAGIAWQAPWFAPFRGPGALLSESDDWIADANRLAADRQLRNHRGLPLRFIPQSGLPEDTGYEAHISATAQVPTRDNLHDFFNALAWLHFPNIKQALNALHAHAFEEPIREHSRKPDCVHDRIERLVAGPYCELFARQKRKGWDVWGNQSDA